MSRKSYRIVVIALCTVLAVMLAAVPGTFAQGNVDQQEESLQPRVERLERELEALRSDMDVVIDALKRLDARLAESLQRDMETGPGAAAQRLEERLDALEAETTDVARTAQEASATAESLAAADLRRIGLNVYGTFNAAFWDGQDSVFDAEAFELVLSGRPHERLGFFAELELERAAEVGAERGGEVLVEQAYASYGLTPNAHLRAGVLLVPFGNYNVDHYAPGRAVITRPLVSQVVAPADWTDNGFGISGDVVLGEGAWGLSYETYLLAGLDQDVTVLGARAGRQPFGEDNNDDKALAGRVGIRRGLHAGSLELGLSAYRGAYDDAGDLDLEGWAVDAHLRRGPFAFQGEFDRLDADGLVRDTRLEGAYGRLLWDLRPAFLKKGEHGRLFPNAKLVLVAQYDWVRTRGPLPDSGAFTTLREERWTFGLNYRPSHQWVLKLHYERNRARDLDLLPALYRGNQRGVLASVGFQF